MASELLLLHAGGVGGVGHVDGERQVRRDGEGARRAAVELDLLLDRCDRHHPAAELAALVAAPEGLERDVGAEPVVHRPRDEPAAIDGPRVGGDHNRIADADQLLFAIAIGGADIDVQAVELHRGLLLLLLEHVDRLAPDDPGDRAVPRLHPDPLTDEDLRVPAPDRSEVEEALLVDVGDEEPDLVDVAHGREERLGTLLADLRDRGPDAVGASAARTTPPRARPQRPGPRSPMAMASKATARATRGSRGRR